MVVQILVYHIHISNVIFLSRRNEMLLKSLSQMEMSFAFTKKHDV